MEGFFVTPALGWETSKLIRELISDTRPDNFFFFLQAKAEITASTGHYAPGTRHDGQSCWQIHGGAYLFQIVIWNKSNIPRRNLCMFTACRNNFHAILILKELQRNNLDEDSIINLKELRGVFKNVSYM